MKKVSVEKSIEPFHEMWDRGDKRIRMKVTIMGKTQAQPIEQLSIMKTAHTPLFDRLSTIEETQT